MNSFYYNNLLIDNQLFFCQMPDGIEFLKDLEKHNINFNFSNVLGEKENGDEYVEQIMVVIDNNEYKKIIQLVKENNINIFNVRHYATYK
jgi:hypothetical protein